MASNKVFGLVGKNIAYSFSRNYFSEKFNALELTTHSYVNFDLSSIQEFDTIFDAHPNELSGLNVTIPYKEVVGEYLDEIDPEADSIGAINTVKVFPSGKKKGYNTDVYGFEKSIHPLLKESHKKALILGTGGASKAVAYAFSKLGISYVFVSRNPKSSDEISYETLSESLMSEYTILVNCTPLGTSPNTDLCPDIPYASIGAAHLLYDLIYNPAETTFLSKGKAQGASIKNGLEMLELQAEKSWEIWNS